ncbi:calcium/sodium antiporter [Pelagicoccus sp. SDUM812002]|uniref:calcium/sodium antiporter n=1 Tax=Pelagicoccus sp. SDUM812002 TaxID=3041266 RepID=UPI00280DD51F|nr:calcium/sodium antiporter [Pelagicoccus sp. SDUM812002]MDQ8184679.1 calcium/sodium antiporter [Pelagicoccus sp. SDUM812002]
MLILAVILSLCLLFLGAEFLVRGASSFASRLGLSPLAVGLTVVAYGTSTPELVVSLQAALEGTADIAVGNVVGSNTFNIGVILGLTALICPIGVERRIVKVDAPVMLLVALLACWFLWDGSLGRLQAAIFLFGCLLYTVLNLKQANVGTTPVDVAAPDESVKSHRRSLWWDLGWFVLGLGLSIGGSKLLVWGASELARGWGVSEAVIGLTIVSAGTSMPELVTSVTAALKRQPDIAIGNVIGSNVFNILGILGISAMVSPIAGSSIQIFDLLVMVLFSLAMLPLIWSGYVLRRVEGAFLMLGYVVYLWVLWP